MAAELCNSTGFQAKRSIKEHAGHACKQGAEGRLHKQQNRNTEREPLIQQEHLVVHFWLSYGHLLGRFRGDGNVHREPGPRISPQDTQSVADGTDWLQTFASTRPGEQ